MTSHYSYDREANAAYLSLRAGEVQRTVEISDQLNADLDAQGAAIGIEILGLDQDGNVIIPEGSLSHLRTLGLCDADIQILLNRSFARK